MKACFEGRLDLGFDLMGVTEDKFTYHPKQQGMDVLTIPVQHPSELDPSWTAAPDEGDYTHYTLFSGGLNYAMNLFGPFRDWEDASDFGEEHRADGEEWEIHVLREQT